MAKLLVIIGITGNQGSSVYNVFKHEPGWRIRGITRDPAKHETLRQEGVELVKADLDDQDSLEKAFSGANAIYAVTDFWSTLFNPNTDTFERAKQEGKKPNQIAKEREIQQGKTIIHAAAKQLSTLERLVFSTLSDASKWSNGEVVEDYHFDSTATSTQYLKDEFPELAKRTSFLEMGNYLSNWKLMQNLMFKKQSDGSFLIQYLLHANGKAQPWVDAPRDTGHFARALILSDKAPAGTTMAGYRGELMTIEEYVALWGKVNGKKVSFRTFTYDDAVADGWPDWMALEITQTGYYQSKFGINGGNPEVKSPRDRGVNMSQLPSVEDWMKNEDWSSVL